MDLKHLQNKHILVVGAGLSGLAVCHFLQKKGAKVTLSDSKSAAAIPEAADLAAAGVQLLLENRLPQQADWDLAVKSPGVPPAIPLLQMVRAAGIPIIGELELAYAYAQAPFVAITGTNGKTTTTAWIGHILELAGRNPLVGGNIGQPLVERVEEHCGVIVAEVSSFQLEDCQSFAPRAALFLNLTPDHLDRHGSLANYLAAKAKIFAAQSPDDFAVLNYDDESLRGLAGQVPSRLLWFSRQNILQEGIFYANGQIIIDLDGEKREILPIAELPLKGSHNLENALAATAAAYAMGVPPQIIAAGLRSFGGVEHRLEFVCEKNGVQFVNDSKGTNPDSTIKALDAYDAPIILIAGGRNKGSDFGELMEWIQRKVKRLVLVGEAKAELVAAAEKAGFDRYICTETFEEAVRQAAAAAQSGDVVLLSPACASWDMFKNYEQRGKLFKDICLKLK